MYFDSQKNIRILSPMCMCSPRCVCVIYRYKIQYVFVRRKQWGLASRWKLCCTNVPIFQTPHRRFVFWWIRNILFLNIIGIFPYLILTLSEYIICMHVDASTENTVYALHYIKCNNWYFLKNIEFSCCYCQLTIARNTMGDTHNHPEHRKFLMQ